MKYHESNFEEYLKAIDDYNLHPELTDILDSFPDNINDLSNVIVYGPSGIGKYSQVLKIISKYSKSNLRYDKKLTVITDRNEKKSKKTDACIVNTATTPDSKVMILPSKEPEYFIRISDVHYEIDMSLLGVNSRTLWHDIFFQIIDILSLKPDKTGIVVCYNYHHIYNELLDVFYSFMRHPLQRYKVKLVFIIITEHIGFIPSEIIDNCQVIGVKRPCKTSYVNAISKNSNKDFNNSVLKDIHEHNITNIKELYCLDNIHTTKEIPTDLFDNIVDCIMEKVVNSTSFSSKEIRSSLYDLLVFNIDITETFSNIIFYLIQNKIIEDEKDITVILKNMYSFLKYYNNNYRSIYHLENMFYLLANKIDDKIT